MDLSMFTGLAKENIRAVRCEWHDDEFYKPYRYGIWHIDDSDFEYHRYDGLLNERNKKATYKRQYQEKEIEMLSKDEFLEAYQNMIFNT